MNVEEEILGRRIRCTVKRANYASFFGDDITDALVQFDDNTGIVTVDERADDVYAKYAALHECVCCGQHADLVPDKGDGCRCAQIDKLLLDMMPENYRKVFSEKRLAMFNTLVEKGLNPRLNDTFYNSIRFHENFLKKRI